MKTTTTLLLTIFALTSLTSCSPHFPAPTPNDNPSFHDLARDVNDEALHAALHGVDLDGGKQYRHGIFRGDRDALEAVRREKEEEALRIVRLAKRQSNNSTVTTTQTTTTTTLPPVTTKRTTTVTNSNGDLQTITEIITITPTDAPTKTQSGGGPGLQTNAAAVVGRAEGWLMAGAGMAGAVVLGGWML